MIRNIAPAIALNMTVGLLYLWSLFLLPLEAALEASRNSLSLVASLALTTFALGMVAYSRLLAKLGSVAFTALVFSLLCGGHLLYGFWPTYLALLLGYGVAFGLAAGLGYGLALSLATGVGDKERALAIGIVMAAFALSGIILPVAIGGWVASSDPAAIFRLIGGIGLILGGLIATYLRIVSPPLGRTPSSGLPIAMLRPDFLRLFLVFFLMCFVGLMLMSQVSGIASDQGLSQAAVLASTSAFTFGYLLGSLFGGRLVEIAGAWVALSGANILALTGLLALGVPAAAMIVFGFSAIGFTFGSTASMMPVLIGIRFGTRSIGSVYGRLIIAYGLAGLSAPWISGALYEASQSYASSLTIAAVMTLAAALISLSFKEIDDVGL